MVRVSSQPGDWSLRGGGGGGGGGGGSRGGGAKWGGGGDGEYPARRLTRSATVWSRRRVRRRRDRSGPRLPSSAGRLAPLTSS